MVKREKFEVLKEDRTLTSIDDGAVLKTHVEAFYPDADLLKLSTDLSGAIGEKKKKKNELEAMINILKNPRKKKAILELQEQLKVLNVLSNLEKTETDLKQFQTEIERDEKRFKELNDVVRSKKLGEDSNPK